MSYAEFNRQGVEGPVVNGVNEPIAADIFTGDIWKHFTRDERKTREAAFITARAALSDLDARIGSGGSFHKTYVEYDGEILERRALVQPFTDPVEGRVHRLIVNDEGFNPARLDQRLLRVSDYMISGFANAFSWQHSAQVHDARELSWSVIDAATGPFLEQHPDSVRLVTGAHYIPRIPSVRGYPSSLLESLDRRQELETFTGIIESLTIDTFVPGVHVGDKLV